jgi:hypothetical protein
VLKHHHTYFSYADSIMPQFFFAVGFAYRMTFLRRWQSDGWPAAARKVTARCLGLLLVALVIHRLDVRLSSWEQAQALGVVGFFREAFQRNFFQTLTHIAVASLWVLPVIGAGAWPRLAYLVLSGAAFVGLSYAGYYEWVMRRPGIDGGPLGFLTWTLPLLAGSLAYDVVQARPVRAAGRLLLAGLAVMALGYLLSCLNRVTPPNQGTDAPLWVEPPFVPPAWPVNIWTMSQRAGSVSYLVFGAGFSLVVYAAFVWLCDRHYFGLGLWRTLGQNALAAYIIHDLADNAIKPLVPKDAPGWYVLAMFGVFFAVCYIMLRYLEKHRLYLRL